MTPRFVKIKDVWHNVDYIVNFELGKDENGDKMLIYELFGSERNEIVFGADAQEAHERLMVFAAPKPMD